MPGSQNLLFKGNTGDVGGGLLYNFPLQSRVTIGLDGRGLLTPGDRGGFFGGAALRVGLVPHHNPLRPYFQVGGGVVHTSYDASLYNYDQFGVPTVIAHRDTITTGAGQFAVGLDIRLADHLDLLLPEYGAAGGTRGGVGYLNVGLVYHVASRR